MILCQDRDQIVAEYSLRGMTRPIGVSNYELTRALPPDLRTALPTVEEIEAELARPSRPRAARVKAAPPRKPRSRESERR